MTDQSRDLDAIGLLLRECNPDQVADVLVRMANTMSFDGYSRGVKLGLAVANKHRTLQGVLVNWIIGILVGLAGQHTDARNMQAIEACNFIAEAVEAGQINHQPFI